nr:Dihydrofolate reductase [uncultured bacterium]
MIISMIVAASKNDVIGRDNKLPWHLPDDMKYFRDLTKGKTVIMGRKTYESIWHPLPNRRNIIISSTLKNVKDCEVFPTLGDALQALLHEKKSDEVFIIGGSRLFAEAIMEIMSDLRAHRLYLTRIHANIEGDIVLPDINCKHWKKISEKEHPKDKDHAYDFTFEVYERD